MKKGITEKTYLAYGGPSLDIGDEETGALVSDALAKALADVNNAGEVIIIPPDITRVHSRGGFITDIVSRELGAGQQGAGRPGKGRPGAGRLGAILPALGTHMALSPGELGRMFPASPKDKFIVHDWRNDLCELGRLENRFVHNITEGAVDYDWPVQVNKLLRKGSASLIVSIGQVVPHEVAGMANHLKNIFIGTGGKEAIDKSHFAGAAYGMEKILGRTDNPVRALFDEAYLRFANALPPVLWVLTVIGSRKDRGAGKTAVPGAAGNPTALRGLFIGFGRECFEKAAALSREVNIDVLDEPVHKAVVYLPPEEYRTTWLGNKAIYRTSMAMAGGGELLILAPGLERFGEDLCIDALIRKYGYQPKKEIAAAVAGNAELGENLCAAAHLIHGSSEGRFTIRYCTSGAENTGDGECMDAVNGFSRRISKKEIESVGFEWGDLETEMTRYDVKNLRQGWNKSKDGERVFFIPNPALGLWVHYGKMPRIL